MLEACSASLTDCNWLQIWMGLAKCFAFRYKPALQLRGLIVFGWRWALGLRNTKVLEYMESCPSKKGTLAHFLRSLGPQPAGSRRESSRWPWTLSQPTSRWTC